MGHVAPQHHHIHVLMSPHTISSPFCFLNRLSTAFQLPRSQGFSDDQLLADTAIPSRIGSLTIPSRIGSSGSVFNELLVLRTPGGPGPEGSADQEDLQGAEQLMGLRENSHQPMSTRSGKRLPTPTPAGISEQPLGKRSRSQDRSAGGKSPRWDHSGKTI